MERQIKWPMGNYPSNVKKANIKYWWRGIDWLKWLTGYWPKCEACVLRTPYWPKCESKYHWPKRLRFGMWKGKEKEGKLQWRGIDWLQKPKFVNFELNSKCIFKGFLFQFCA